MLLMTGKEGCTHIIAIIINTTVVIALEKHDHGRSIVVSRSSLFAGG